MSDHFVPSVPLAATVSFTGSDVDAAIAGTTLYVNRGLFYIGSLAPTISDSPDFAQLCWAKPVGDTHELYMYDSGTTTWTLIVGGVQVTEIPDNSIALSKLSVTSDDEGKVMTAIMDGVTPVAVWQDIQYSNIPPSAITVGTANQLFVTNNAGTVSTWTSFTTLLASLGAVIKPIYFDGSGYTTGQYISWNGTRFAPASLPTTTLPASNNAAWSGFDLLAYDPVSNISVRKTRKQLLDTAIADYTTGSFASSTILMGWNSASTPVLGTVAQIISLAVDVNKKTSPILTIPFTFGPAGKITWQHNLTAGRPTSVVVTLVCKTSYGNFVASSSTINVDTLLATAGGGYTLTYGPYFVVSWDSSYVYVMPKIPNCFVSTAHGNSFTGLEIVHDPTGGDSTHLATRWNLQIVASL